GAGPVGQGVGASGGVGGGGGDVGADQLGWEQQAGAGLDQLAFGGVVAVRAPDAVGVGHHAQVDAASAAGAGLDLEARVGGLELIDQVIDGLRLGVHGGPAGGPGARLDQGPVVVPLDVVDLVFAHQGTDPVAQVGVGLRDGQVQHLLVAVAHRQALAGGEDPVRVGPGQVG